MDTADRRAVRVVLVQYPRDDLKELDSAVRAVADLLVDVFRHRILMRIAGMDTADRRAVRARVCRRMRGSGAQHDREQKRRSSDYKARSFHFKTSFQIVFLHRVEVRVHEPVGIRRRVCDAASGFARGKGRRIEEIARFPIRRIAREGERV